MPWTDLRLVPDFVALVLIFWCIRQPRLVGIGVAWCVGLISDVRQRRAARPACAGLFAPRLPRVVAVPAYPVVRPGLQALHVAAMLLVAEGVMIVVRLAAGDQPPGLPVIVGPLARGPLWPVVSWLLLLPQRRLEREQTI